jgi:hypothetical protein
MTIKVKKETEITVTPWMEKYNEVLKSISLQPILL